MTILDLSPVSTEPVASGYLQAQRILQTMRHRRSGDAEFTRDTLFLEGYLKKLILLEAAAAALKLQLEVTKQEGETAKAHLRDLTHTVDGLEEALAWTRTRALAIETSTTWLLSKPVRQILTRLPLVRLAARHCMRLALGSSANETETLRRTIQARNPTQFIPPGGMLAVATKAARILRRDGPRGFARRARSAWAARRRGSEYQRWIQTFDSLDDLGRARIKRHIAQMEHAPLISIIMPVCDPPVAYLDAAIRSLNAQLYGAWELCIADDASENPEVHRCLEAHAAADPRIHLFFRNKRGHIAHASNSALELATGEFVGLLDHDDLLAEDALYRVAVAIKSRPDAGLLYSDEDKIDTEGRRFDPYFKSDWNPDLFRSQNMVSHFGVYRTALVRKVGGFREGFEGSQDYDLAFRCIERLNAAQIVHIPRVLYHWRAHPASTACGGAVKPYAIVAGVKALADHLHRQGTAAEAHAVGDGLYRVRYVLSDPAPRVTLIIPTRDRVDLLRRCVGSILMKTIYPDFDIIIIDNGSIDFETLKYFKTLRQLPRLRIIHDDRPFNYSALNNRAVEEAEGEFVALVNNDIEIISPDWLEEMVSLAMQPGVGAVGARLLYPDDTVQHAGVILGLGGIAGHAQHRKPREDYGYFCRGRLMQTLSAVTAACLVVRKSVYQEVGGLDPHLAVAFNDVDFCLKLREAGYRNVWTPYAELYHHESASRGYEDTPEKLARLQSEIAFMHGCWGDALRHDPAYNPNLSLDGPHFSLAWPPRHMASNFDGLVSKETALTRPAT